MTKTTNYSQSVFVIGFPRSGTTLLLHFLMSSQKFPTYKFDETHFFSHYYQRYGDIGKEKNYKRFINDLVDTDWFQTANICINDLQEIKPETRSYSNIFEIAMQNIAAQQGYSRWLEKTPWHMLYTKEIKASLPNSKFIFIIRDPRDVILSITQYGWIGGIFQGPARAAISWCWHMRKIMPDIKALNNDVLTVHYENLVNNPIHAASEISNFLDINIDAETINTNANGVLRKTNSSFNFLDKDKNNPVFRWKSNDNKKLIHQLNYILRNDINKYGYEKSDYSLVSFTDKLKIKFTSVIFNFLKTLRQILFPLIRK